MGDHLKMLIHDTPEAVFGGVALVVVLVICYGIGRAGGAIQNVRYTQAWGPLVSVIGGTIRNDRSGPAVSSFLTGTYGGRQIEADMTPGRNVSHIETDHLIDVTTSSRFA